MSSFRHPCILHHLESVVQEGWSYNLKPKNTERKIYVEITMFTPPIIKSFPLLSQYFPQFYRLAIKVCKKTSLFEGFLSLCLIWLFLLWKTLILEYSSLYKQKREKGEFVVCKTVFGRQFLEKLNYQ